MPALSTAGTTGKPSPVPKELSPSSRRHGRDGDTVTPSAGPPYPGQDLPAQPGSIPAPWGAGYRARGQPGSTAADKGPLFP